MSIKKSHKIGKVLCTPDFLENALLFPAGDKITDVRWNYKKQRVEFMVKSDSFDDIPVGEKIPDYNGMYVTMMNRENISYIPYFKGWKRVENE